MPIRPQRGVMHPRAQYRIKAAEFHAKATRETDPLLRAEFERLTQWYIRLAELADRNAVNGVDY